MGLLYLRDHNRPEGRTPHGPNPDGDFARDESRAGPRAGFEQMVAFLRAEGLMIQKIPERLETIALLPRNPTGKVLKQKLRERYG